MAETLRVLFAGTPDFAASHLQALLASQHDLIAVLTQPDRPAGRGKRDKPSPVKQCALDANVRVLQPTTLKTVEAQEAIRALNPDVMIVVAYGLILPQAVLDIPRLGCLNVHASLLPRWRGAAPIQRAVAAGDATSGITIMQMEAGLDTGPALAMAQLTLTGDETGGSLHDRLAETGPPLLLSTLDGLEQALATAEPQNDALATYAHKITKAEAAIDWSLSADAIERRIRAFNPSPVCFTQLQEERIKVWEASVNQLPGGQASPGELLRADRKGLLVACGENALMLTRLQFPGGKPLDAAALMNGRGRELQPGIRFAGNSDGSA